MFILYTFIILILTNSRQKWQGLIKIITPKATREITILFYQKLNGTWTTFSEYPRSELKTLYACYRAQHFKHKQPDEEVKKEFIELVKRCYSDWMFHIKNPIFKKYRDKEDRYKNGLTGMPYPRATREIQLSPSCPDSSHSSHVQGICIISQDAQSRATCENSSVFNLLESSHSLSLSHNPYN